MSNDFKNDIIIANDKGKLFQLSQKDLEKFEIPSFRDDSDYDEVVRMLKDGVQVAAIPVSAANGGAHARGDLFCYLLNLAGLKTKTSWEKEDG